ncbi:hypothetical protein RI367_008782 [Sorochytrium milnesiophthora]
MLNIRSRLRLPMLLAVSLLFVAICALFQQHDSPIGRGLRSTSWSGEARMRRAEAVKAERTHRLMADALLNHTLRLVNVGSMALTSMQGLANAVYPWLKAPVRELQRNFSSRGIVISTGRSHAHFAYMSIISIRRLGCQLPVEIVYGGDKDLPLQYREVFERLEGVTVLDMTSRIKWDVAGIKGWAMKPFAILMSSFAEVILLDADVVLMQSPDVMFNDTGYNETGALFFHDRTLWVDEKSHKWFKAFLPDPSETAKSLRHWRQSIYHEQESGVLVVRKSSHALLGLLGSCSLNAEPIRDEIVYKMVHGDKETFWIGFEMAAQAYSFVPGYGSAIGIIGQHAQAPGPIVCGPQLHVDRNKRPLWWNGGLEVDKVYQPGRLGNYSYYTVDENGEHGKWEWDTADHAGPCLHNGEAAPIPLTDAEKEWIVWMEDQWRSALGNADLAGFWDGSW